MARGSSGAPLFRFTNRPFILIVQIFRWICFFMYAFAIGWINTHPLPPDTINFGGNIKYLTYWNLLFQFALFALINYCDIFLPQTGRHRPNAIRSNVLLKLRDLIHHGIALPIGMAVTILFWTIYAIDAELMYPMKIRPYYPEWLNHITHTFVGFTVIIEEIIYYHPRDNRKSFITLFTFLALYFTWFIYLGYVINLWVYPVIRIVPDLYRLPFILSFGLVFLALFYFINFAHGALWQVRSRKEKRR